MSRKNYPAVLDTYRAMWNERDLDLIRGHLDASVANGCVWVDPQHNHTGRAALEENVRGFRSSFPDAVLELGSNIDGHNNRYRYEWYITTGEDLLIRGFDVVTLNSAGLIERVDGFFGELKSSGPH